ncbi:hypothetical protein CAOG_02147 [Capsaspora owczarzaki ATCC 30864]|nr:hypothetical protein CAOG_02147 [Capsaspora owczarzaki ATCC 30864]|eukprot:XP_004348897.2 hypothetical protein CAOG_02147 [Capsaspora owczarzaki ATCC 30864]
MQAASAHTQARPCGSSDGKLEMPKLFTASELKAMFLAHETADQADAIHQIEMLERSPSDMQSWPAASCPFASMMSSRLATPPAQRPSENEDVQALQGCFNYLQDFLGKPHPALGRKGPTCPFVPTGLKKDSIYVGSVTTTPATTKDQIVELMRGFPDKFLQLEPRQGPLVSYKAIVVTFPYMSLADAPLLIDSVQNELKAEFVNKGLMIGEFHLANNASSLNNPDFFPLRTPKPCIAMRFMVPGDLVFMSLDQYPTSMRINLLESYISNLTSSGNPLSNKESDLVHTARVQLDAARSG